jgi:hypothetical protein
LKIRKLKKKARVEEKIKKTTTKKIAKDTRVKLI